MLRYNSFTCDSDMISSLYVFNENLSSLQLLKFARQSGTSQKNMENAFESQPNLKLNFKLTNSTSKLEKSRKYSHPNSEFS